MTPRKTRAAERLPELVPGMLTHEYWQIDVPPAGLAAVWRDEDSFTGKAVARIAGPEGPLCLRRLPVGTSVAWLRTIHQAVAYLESRGFHYFPSFRVTEDGGTIVKHSGQVYDLATWVPGEPILDPATLGSATLESLGAAIGQLHVAGAGSPGPVARTDWLTTEQATTQRLAWDPTPISKDAWQNPATLGAFFASLTAAGSPARVDGVAWPIVQAAEAAIASLAQSTTTTLGALANQPRTLTHGDLWPDHARWESKLPPRFAVSPANQHTSLVALTDLDTLALRPPSGDLAALFADFGRWDIERCAAILAGYRRFRPVDAPTLAALPRLGSLRTLGVLRERLRVWLAAGLAAEEDDSPNQLLGGPVPYWRDQLTQLAEIDPTRFASTLS